MSHAANTSIQDTQNGIGDFTLLPEADRNSLDDYMKLPEQNRLNTCSHGYLIEQGVKSHMPYHDDGSGDWTLCKDDPDYGQYVAAGNPTSVPANPVI